MYHTTKKFYCVGCGRVSETPQECCGREMLVFDEFTMLNAGFNH